MAEDDALEGRLVGRAIENAQKKVEGFHFDIRKHLLEYDDVLNKQREVIYGLRKEVLEGEDIGNMVREIVPDVVEDIVLFRANEKDPVAAWDIEGMFKEVNRQFGLALDPEAYLSRQRDGADKKIAQELFETFKWEALTALQEREERFGEDVIHKLARFLYMQGIDFFWKEHLTNMDQLREGISLRAYGQKNPLHEYQRESFELFTAMMMTVKSEVLLRLFTSDLLSDEEIAAREEAEKEKQRKREEAARTIHEDVTDAKKKSDAQGANRRQRRRIQAMEKNTVPSAEADPILAQPIKKRDTRKKAKAQRKARRKNR
jgi:preprotein translocase subunit SecA